MRIWTRSGIKHVQRVLCTDESLYKAHVECEQGWMYHIEAVTASGKFITCPITEAAYKEIMEVERKG